MKKMVMTFTASSDDHAKHNGPVEVIRPLTIEEVDDEVGPMFKCRAPSGEEFDAFDDELE